MRLLKGFLQWLFAEPCVTFSEMESNHNALLISMREDLW